jgi:phage gp36-like protein
MYATKDDMISRFGLNEVTGIVLEGNDTEVDVDVILGDALADAASEIDSYLRSRYNLPITTASTSLKRCATDLAFYNLHKNRLTDLVEKRHDDWIKWLVGVSKGMIALDVAIDPPADGAAVPVLDGGSVEFQHTRPAIFGGPY